MSKENILVFKLGKEYDDKMSPESVFDAHIYHASNHEGKVLFTTQMTISKDFNKLILIALSSNKVAMANAERFETYSDAKVKGYTVPSQWRQEETFSESKQAEYNKFGLSDFEVMEKGELANYINVSTDKSLIDSISGASCIIYVKAIDV